MDAGLFTKMLSDKSVTDLKKLKYKYPQADLAEFVSLLKGSFYHALPLKDFDGGQMVYLESVAQVRLSAARVLLTPQDSSQPYGIKAMEEEIVSTLSIEQIDTSRDSVRKILSGYAPANESEKRIYAMKKGLEFIVDPAHQISEENLHQLYEMTIGVLLPEEDRLLPGNLYRNDSVYVVGDKVEYTGLSWKKLPEYMGALIEFANMDGDMNDLLKAALLHFDLAYLHPYFDGNGRMARLLHLWYLVQRGYSSALFVPRTECPDQRRPGCDALPGVFHRKCLPQTEQCAPGGLDNGAFSDGSGLGQRDGEGKGLVAVRTVRLWRRGVLYKAAGAGFRQRRLCHHPQFRPEIRGDGPLAQDKVWKPGQIQRQVRHRAGCCVWVPKTEITFLGSLRCQFHHRKDGQYGRDCDIFYAECFQPSLELSCGPGCF